MPVFLRCLTLLLLLFITPSYAAGIPGLLGSSAPAQPQASEPLAKSLDEVIKNLENDQQRSKLLADLKKLRDASKQTQANPEQGVLGLISGALHDIEKQFSGDESPFRRWSLEINQAQDELSALIVPVQQWPAILFGFAAVIAVWSLLAMLFNWIGQRVRLRFGLKAELPQHPRTGDLVLFALRKLGPWLVALIITVYLSFALPPSLGKSMAMVLAYALVVGTCFSAICVIAFSLLDGPHRHRALHILRHQAFRPLWLIGSFAAFGEAMNDPRLTAALGTHLAHALATLANVLAALCTGLFVLRFRRPIAHLIRNQPLSRRLNRRTLSDTIEILGSFWFIPAMILVAISLVATFVSVAIPAQPCASR